MKFPVRRVPGTVPPQFEYTQIVTTPSGGVQAVKLVGGVPSSMESALCDLLRIAEQQAKELETLRRKK